MYEDDPGRDDLADDDKDQQRDGITPTRAEGTKEGGKQKKFI